MFTVNLTRAGDGHGFVSLLPALSECDAFLRFVHAALKADVEEYSVQGDVINLINPDNNLTKPV